MNKHAFKKPHPRLVLASALVTILMLPVGFVLSAIGIWGLEISGGAANDTSLVVLVTAFAVSDFWGGGIVATITKVRAREAATTWLMTRGALLLLLALVLPKMLPLLPIQIGLAFFAAWAGARSARKQAHLRSQVERNRKEIETDNGALQ